jgi:hypothetical protein
MVLVLVHGKNKETTTCNMSKTTITHWATPLHSIPPPSHDTIVSSRLKLNQQSKTIEVPTSTSSVSVSIPRTGLYGFILGQDNFNGKTTTDGQISFESKILIKMKNLLLLVMLLRM